MLGSALLGKQGHSALYRSLHSVPLDLGRTEDTHAEGENAAEREVVCLGGVKLHQKEAERCFSLRKREF